MATECRIADKEIKIDKILQDLCLLLGALARRLQDMSMERNSIDSFWS